MSDSEVMDRGRFEGEVLARLKGIEISLKTITDARGADKQELLGLIHDQDKKIEALEAWRLRILGGAAVIALVMSWIAPQLPKIIH